MTKDPERVVEGSTIFRREALEHRARQRGPGDVLRVAPRWTTAAFYVLIGLFAMAMMAGVVIKIDLYAGGITATDAEGRLVVLLPAALAPDVARGRPVELQDARARVISSDETVLYPLEIKKRYGVEVTAPSVVILTSADGVAGQGGIARVLIEREPVIVALIPGLKGLLGGEGA